MEKQTNKKLQDEGKLAYMISWRDRRIKALEQIIEAQEQAGRIYAAYIACLLHRCGEQTERGCKMHISKQEIREICGAYEVQADDAGESFIITLVKRGATDAERRSEMADA